MKHLIIFESKSAEKLVLDTMNEYDKICDLIRDFINLEELSDGVINHVTRYYVEHDVDDNIEFAIVAEAFKVGRYDPDDDNFVLIKDLEKLYRFIDNPEQYKNSKKYNL